jgi:DNA primase
VTETKTTTNTERYGFRRCATEVQAAVPISRYVSDSGLTELRSAGVRLVGRCMFHEDKSPSFTVYGDSSFYCFGCMATGDVIDLHAHAGGHTELWTAMLDLANRYAVELPQRPTAWYARQDEKARTREAATNYIAGVYQRRLTKVFTPLVLVGGETPEEELESLERLASALWPISLDMAGRRVSGE